MGGSALPILGGVLGLYQTGQAASGQKRAARAQEGIARNQTQLFQQTTPYYNAILQYLSQNAGLPGYGGSAQPGFAGGTPAGQAGSLMPHLPRQPSAPRNQGFSPATPATAQPTAGLSGSTPLPTGSGALPDNLLGIFGQDPAQRLQFQQAEEDIGRVRDVREDQLRYLLGRQGAGAATTSAALTRNESEYQTGLAGFRRQLAMAARAEQERRAGLLLSALGPGLGAGPAAAGIFGNQANLYGGQASAASSGIGSMIANLMLMEALRRGQGTGTGGFGGGAGPVQGPIDPDNPLSQLLMGRGF